MDENTRQQIALFRYGLIADLVHRPEGERGLYALLRQKAERAYEIPGSRRTRAALDTLRDWLAAYRCGGFEALYPKPRSDRGQARAIPQEVADLLCSIKEDNLALSVLLVIDEAQRIAQLPESLYLAPATVHRLLSRHGLMDKRPAEPTTKDRRRFAFDKANELWMSDVMHGPAVFVEDKRKRKTYLIALLDDATRLVAFAAFALSENTAAFLPVLQQAILRRGIPKRLYVDSVSGHRIDVARFEHLVANLDRRRARETSPAVENLDACARKALFSGPGHGLVERALEAHQLRPIDGDASGADPFASQARERVHRFGRANQHLFGGHNL